MVMNQGGAKSSRRADTLIRPSAPIVPSGSIAGRSLMAVVAIMTFLVALTAGGVLLIASAASDWGSQISREVTIQLRPVDGRDIEADIAKAAALARNTQGVSDVQAYSREETQRMLTPWLGDNLDMGDLPIPRLIVVKIASGALPDFATLKKALADTVPGASLDDHRFWIARLIAMARAMVLGGIAILLLMVVATALSVVFATRGAMAGNKDVVEVLHFVGAHDSFIAHEFQHHFLWLGLKGGLMGGGAAVLTFIVAHQFATRLTATAAGDQMQALFGSFSMDWRGYAAIAIAVALIAVITGATSRMTVHRVLRGQI